MITLLIIGLTLATAVIHFMFYLEDPGGGIIYLLNALGFVTLVALLYLPLPLSDPFRRPVRYLLMGFAALTILAYLGFGILNNEWTIPLGPITKLIEVSLIALLWIQGRQPETKGRQDLAA